MLYWSNTKEKCLFFLKNSFFSLFSFSTNKQTRHTHLENIWCGRTIRTHNSRECQHSLSAFWANRPTKKDLETNGVGWRGSVLSAVECEGTWSVRHFSTWKTLWRFPHMCPAPHPNPSDKWPPHPTPPHPGTQKKSDGKLDLVVSPGALSSVSAITTTKSKTSILHCYMRDYWRTRQMTRHCRQNYSHSSLAYQVIVTARNLCDDGFNAFLSWRHQRLINYQTKYNLLALQNMIWAQHMNCLTNLMVSSGQLNLGHWSG